ncbi:hypothetical protein TRFO_38888 [Tritrichomonas foetus]|uniref:Raptor N-terminal CASPase-like domain-containing protein n=1 Tax=Tritrichomonas foetus TaxID=1144522 RepID=A0A1J4JCE7_9EUKA|nr:hypothetical protein TRFO_38888 [Tritrichomonas foetus]|eukprot:OHS94940.1 hypothetical protein TRFO_38888 [Tritrichomonas foetus]
MQRHPSPDYGYYKEFEDSEGEASESLCSSPNTFSKSMENAILSSDNEINIVSCFNNIDKSFLLSNTPNELCPNLATKDFNIQETQKEIVIRYQNQTEITECIITSIPHPNSFPKIASDYSMMSPNIIGWIDIQSLPPADFNTFVNSYLKKGYQKIKEHIRFLQIFNPNIEKMNNLIGIRRDIPVGRIMFHFIGSYNAVEGKNLYLANGKTKEYQSYPVKKLFSNLNIPSGFIFDCDNGGSLIYNLEKQSNKLKSAVSINFSNPENVFSKKPSYDDWFAFSLTSEREKLPLCQNLPRDFLTCCIISPVDISIICHILQYYKISFPSNSLIALIKSRETDTLYAALNAICEGVLTDFLSNDMIYTMLRTDPIIAHCTKFFALAQFLLIPYNIHPISRPVLPLMTSHHLWMQWQATIDIWVSNSTQSGFSDSIFLNSIESFKYYWNGQISNSLLSIINNIPYLESEKYDYIFPLLANYCMKSAKNRQQFVSVVLFINLFQKFLCFNPQDKHFESICYLILCTLKTSPKLVFSIGKEYDLTTLCKLVFYPSLNWKSHAYICSIISMIIPATRMIRLVLCSYDYLNDFLKLLFEKRSSFLLSNIILLQRILKYSFDELPQIDPLNFATVSIVSIFHSNYEIRAASLSVLISFLRQNSSKNFNYMIILFSIFLISDMSYMVRHLLLNLICKYITIDASIYTTSSTKNIQITSTHAFSNLISFWMNEEIDLKDIQFDKYLLHVQNIMKKANLTNDFKNIIYFVIDYFCRDPHPFIKNTAQQMKTFLSSRGKMYSTETQINITTGSSSSSLNSSSNPKSPINSLIQSSDSSWRDSVLDESDSDNDTSSHTTFYESEALFNSITNQLIKIESYYLKKFSHIKGLNKSLHRLSFTVGKPLSKVNHESLELKRSRSFDTKEKINSYVKTVTLQNEIDIQKLNFNSRINKMIFVNDSLDLIITTNDQYIYLIENNYMKNNKTANVIWKQHIFDGVSDLRVQNDNYYSKDILISTNDGCCSLWNSFQKSPNVIFRADSNYLCELVPQFATFSGKSYIVSSRGNSGLSKWDINTQRLAGEWMHTLNHDSYTNFNIISALHIHPLHENIIISGFNDGCLVAIDLRQKENIFEIKLSEKIISVTDDGNNVFAATANGESFIWDLQKVDLNRCGLKRGKIMSFDSNTENFIFTSNEGIPFLTEKTNTSDILKIKEVSDVMVSVLHPNKKYAACGSRNGEVNVISIGP